MPLDEGLHALDDLGDALSKVGLDHISKGGVVLGHRADDVLERVDDTDLVVESAVDLSERRSVESLDGGLETVRGRSAEHDALDVDDEVIERRLSLSIEGLLLLIIIAIAVLLGLRVVLVVLDLRDELVDADGAVEADDGEDGAEGVSAEVDAGALREELRAGLDVKDEGHVEEGGAVRADDEDLEVEEVVLEDVDEGALRHVGRELLEVLLDLLGELEGTVGTVLDELEVGGGVVDDLDAGELAISKLDGLALFDLELRETLGDLLELLGLFLFEGSDLGL